jgi:hypothetical protein
MKMNYHHGVETMLVLRLLPDHELQLKQQQQQQEEEEEKKPIHGGVQLYLDQDQHPVLLATHHWIGQAGALDPADSSYQYFNICARFLSLGDEIYVIFTVMVLFIRC